MCYNQATYRNVTQIIYMRNGCHGSLDAEMDGIHACSARDRLKMKNVHLIDSFIQFVGSYSVWNAFVIQYKFAGTLTIYMEFCHL